MSVKEVKANIKLQIPAGKANPSPPVGPALGQHGLNIAEFCKKFNDQSMALEGVEQGTVLPVIISVFADRTYDFVIKQPPMSKLILSAVGQKSGSGEPNSKKIAHLTVEQIKQIAIKKQPDLTASNLYAAMNTVVGTARSMGVTADEFTLEDI